MCIYIFIDFYIHGYIFDLKYIYRKGNQTKMISHFPLFYFKILFYYKPGEVEFTTQRVCHDLTLSRLS